MNTLFGQEKLPLIIIHGGASPIDPKGDAFKRSTLAYSEYGRCLYERFNQRSNCY